MSKIRYQTPVNFGGLSHAGESYSPDEDGIIEVPARVPTEVILAHGLTPAEAKKAPKKPEPLAKTAKGGAKEGTETNNDGAEALKAAQEAEAAGTATDEQKALLAKVAAETKTAQKGAKTAKGGEQ